METEANSDKMNEFITLDDTYYMNDNSGVTGTEEYLAAQDISDDAVNANISSVVPELSNKQRASHEKELGNQAYRNRQFEKLWYITTMQFGTPMWHDVLWKYSCDLLRTRPIH